MKRVTFSTSSENGSNPNSHSSSALEISKGEVIIDPESGDLVNRKVSFGISNDDKFDNTEFAAQDESSKNIPTVEQDFESFIKYAENRDVENMEKKLIEFVIKKIDITTLMEKYRETFEHLGPHIKKRKNILEDCLKDFELFISYTESGDREDMESKLESLMQRVDIIMLIKKYQETHELSKTFIDNLKSKLKDCLDALDTNDESQDPFVKKLVQKSYESTIKALTKEGHLDKWVRWECKDQAPKNVKRQLRYFLHILG